MSRPAPARWSVRVGRRRWQRSEPGWLEVESGGAKTWVEVSSLVEIFGTAEETDGVVEDLAEQAGLVGEIAPPGTPARLAHTGVAVGDEVAILGTLAGPSVVHGAVIARGPDARARLDETIARRAGEAPRTPGKRKR